MMNSLYEKYEYLINQNKQDNYYKVLAVSENSNHRIGCSENGFPMLFVKCSDTPKCSKIKLDLIELDFNLECSIHLENSSNVETNIYHIAMLKTENKELLKYFLDIFYLILNKLDSIPSTSAFRAEVYKLIELFTSSSEFSSKTVQGLWAEMLVIEQSENPDYLINSWHVEKTDKFDFNDGIDKLEVKSNSQNTRIHSFSIEQLSPNEGSNLLVASIITSHVGVGSSVFDLEKSIIEKLEDSNSIYKLKQMMVKTIGKNFDKAAEYLFDYTLAVDSYQLYDYKKIPSIKSKDIPQGVLNVHFQADLANIKPVNKNKLVGNLYSSL